MDGAISKLHVQLITNGFTVLKKHAILIPVLSLSLFSFSPLAFADYGSQNTGLGSFLGSVTGALNKVRDAAQNVQAGLAQGVSNVSAQTSFQSDPTENMSDADKQLMAQGMWHDARTGLTWMRCPLQETWNGSGCSLSDKLQKQFGVKNSYGGNYSSYGGIDPAIRDISQLNFGGFNDWRLPTIEELSGLFNSSQCAATQYSKAPKNGGVGTIDIPTNCSTSDNSVLFINTKIFPISDFTDNSWFFSASNKCLDDRPLVPDGETTWMISFKGGLNCQNIYTGGNNSQHGNVFAVRGGTSTGEYEHELAETNAYYGQQKKIKAADNIREAKYNAEMKQENAEYNAKIAAFQKSLRVGQHVAQGIVLEINGNLIRIQTHIPACNPVFYNCAGPEKWVNRSDLTPLLNL